MKFEKIGGRIFKKSSYSPSARSTKCVYVSISKDNVLVTDISTEAPILRFSSDEWHAFIKGVKNGEFDLN